MARHLPFDRRPHPAHPRGAGAAEIQLTELDVDDQVRLLKQLLAADNIDDKRWPARMLAGLIDGWKNRGLTPDKVPAAEGEVYANGKGAKLLLNIRNA